jgi:hypothetical protein
MALSLLLGAFILAALSLGGCGRIKVTKAPGGAMHITCAKGMKDCVTRAAKACGQDGYVILSGKSTNHLLSGETSSYRKLSESADLEVLCGSDAPAPKKEIVYRLPERPDVEEPGPSVQACVPGVTQRCVGPGACDGGQVCLASGQAFGVCDCGGSPAPQGKPPEPRGGSAQPLPQPPRQPSTLDPSRAPTDQPPEVGMPAPTPLGNSQ